jgi:hypothetical protein
MSMSEFTTDTVLPFKNHEKRMALPLPRLGSSPLPFQSPVIAGDLGHPRRLDLPQPPQPQRDARQFRDLAVAEPHGLQRDAHRPPTRITKPKRPQ